MIQLAHSDLKNEKNLATWVKMSMPKFHPESRSAFSCGWPCSRCLIQTTPFQPWIVGCPLGRLSIIDSAKICKITMKHIQFLPFDFLTLTIRLVKLDDFFIKPTRSDSNQEAAPHSCWRSGPLSSCWKAVNCWVNCWVRNGHRRRQNIHDIHHICENTIVR